MVFWVQLNKVNPPNKLCNYVVIYYIVHVIQTAGWFYGCFFYTIISAVHAFLAVEGPILLEMRIKHLIKEGHLSKAALLAKACFEFPEFEGKGHFKQMYLVSICNVAEQEQLMEEVFPVSSFFLFLIF